MPSRTMPSPATRASCATMHTAMQSISRSMCSAGVTALLAAGCLSTPPFQPESGLKYTANGPGGTVAGPGFELQFSRDPGIRFPDALRIDGTDVLGHETMPGCFGTDEAGILIAPTPRISAHGGALPVKNQLVAGLLGPAVVQVVLEWATRMACSLSRTPSGTSTFTVFPDGRIVRYDQLFDSSSAEVSANECACDRNADGSDGFTVATFWTLARQGFVDLRPSVQDGNLPAPGVTASSNVDSACLGGSAYQVAFAWPDPTSTSIVGGNAIIAFARDMLYRDSRLDPYTWDNSTAIFIERSGCDAALARADEHVRPRPLMLNGETIVPSARDGIYGSVAGDGEHGVVLAANRAELTGTTHGSFAVWLRFPHATDALRATLDGKTGPWYLPQRVDDRAWLVWFRDPISTGQTIVIEPR